MADSDNAYATLLRLVKTRTSICKFRPDPIPEDTIDKILEVTRWAMSGANPQRWEFIVVTDPEIKHQLHDAYSEYTTDFIPIGYPDVPAREGVRRPLNEIVHRERYDMGKYMSNKDVIRYLYSLRKATVPLNSSSRGVKAEEQ